MPLTQDEPSIAALADGRFVVTYTDRLTDPGGDIRGRFHDPTAGPVRSSPSPPPIPTMISPMSRRLPMAASW